MIPFRIKIAAIINYIDNKMFIMAVENFRHDLRRSISESFSNSQASWTNQRKATLNDDKEIETNKRCQSSR